MGGETPQTLLVEDEHFQTQSSHELAPHVVYASKSKRGVIDAVRRYHTDAIKVEAAFVSSILELPLG